MESISKEKLKMFKKNVQKLMVIEKLKYTFQRNEKKLFCYSESHSEYF